MTKAEREREHDVMETSRQARIWKLIPSLPWALETLSRCLAQPCDAQKYARAREIVLRWLQFTQACESHAIARR
jgi:hypothetical protein